MTFANDNQDYTNFSRLPASSGRGSDRLLRIPQVCGMTGLSRSTLYRLQGRGMFLVGIHLTPSSVRWSGQAISDWIEEKTLVPKLAA